MLPQARLSPSAQARLDWACSDLQSEPGLRPYKVNKMAHLRIGLAQWGTEILVHS